MQANGFYIDADLGEPQAYYSDIEKKKAEEGGYELSSDDRYTLYEIHADLIIEGFDDEDGLAKPYVVTIERGTQTVLSIRRNWNPEDPLKLKRPFLGLIPDDTATPLVALLLPNLGHKK